MKSSEPMNPSSMRTCISVASIFLAASAQVGCSRGAGGSTAGSAAPVATVQTAKVQRGSLQETLKTYGTVVFDPHQTKTISFERSGHVEKLFVTTGQGVSKGDELLTLGSLPEGTLEVQQARIELRFAESELERLQRQLEEKLATNDQVQKAEKQVSSTRAALEALGVGAPPRTLTAPFSGVVSDVLTTSGALVRADERALVLAPATGVVVQVGFEIEDTANLSPGLAVSLEPVFPIGGQEPARGALTRLHRVVDPATQLVEGWVTPTDRPAWMISGTRVRVGVVVHSAEGALKVTRRAVMARDGQRGVFVVQEGSAHWTPVEIGIEGEEEVEVLSGLKEGSSVVTVGKTSLEDGMAVQTAKSSS